MPSSTKPAVFSFALWQPVQKVPKNSVRPAAVFSLAVVCGPGAKFAAVWLGAGAAFADGVGAAGAPAGDGDWAVAAWKPRNSNPAARAIPPRPWRLQVCPILVCHSLVLFCGR